MSVFGFYSSSRVDGHLDALARMEAAVQRKNNSLFALTDEKIFSSTEELTAEITRQLLAQFIVRDRAEAVAMTAELYRTLVCKALLVIKHADSLQLSLPPKLDAAWHVAILNTDLYHKFCNLTLGLDKLLPHSTASSFDDLSTKNKRITAMEMFYRKKWMREPTPSFWERERPNAPGAAAEQDVEQACGHKCKDKLHCKHACCKRGGGVEMEPAAKRQRDDADERYQIHVRTLDTAMEVVEVSGGMPVILVKYMMQMAKGINVDMQRLIFAGMNLSDDRTLESYNIENMSTVQLVTRLRGC